MSIEICQTPLLLLLLLCIHYETHKGHAHLCCLVIHYFLCCQITLVAHQQLVDILICISINLIQPLLDIVETFLVCDIVYDL